MKNYNIVIFLYIFLGFFLLGCGSNSNKNGEIVEDENILTSDQALNNLGAVEQYYGVAEGHNLDTDTVLLGSQGGPANRLMSSYFRSYHSLFTVVYVHQSQSLTDEMDGLDSSLLDGSEIISNQKARNAVLKSAAILHKVAAHFVTQGKTVYLITHSYGSFVILHTLAHYGNNFDKILIKAGRVEIPEEVFTAFRDECGGLFASDAITFQKVDCSLVRPTVPLESFQSLRSGGRLQSALGENRYHTLLSNVSLNNLLYVYGNRDQAVGKLSDEEINFLEGRGAQVEEFDGGHDIDLDFENIETDSVAEKAYNFLND